MFRKERLIAANKMVGPLTMFYLLGSLIGALLAMDFDLTYMLACGIVGLVGLPLILDSGLRYPSIAIPQLLVGVAALAAAGVLFVSVSSTEYLWFGADALVILLAGVLQIANGIHKLQNK